jgi:hypothetical protein
MHKIMLALAILCAIGGGLYADAIDRHISVRLYNRSA